MCIRDRVLVDIFFDGLSPDHHAYFIKTALRKAQAISVINITVVLKLMDGQIQDPQITLGSTAPTIIHAVEAEKYLEGKQFNQDVIAKASSLAASAARPISDVRGSADYRDYMVLSLIHI